MKKYINLLCLLALACAAKAQTTNATDSAEIDRTVYVTRDFQPTVQSAGKISVKPAIFEPKIEIEEPQYSNYSSPLALDYTMNKLDFSTLNFRQPASLNGYLRAGVGHTNSLFSFNYRISDAMMQQKNATRKRPSANDLIFDVYANHIGQWGVKALSESGLGMDIAKTFPKTEFYFGANGGHEFYSRYGHYFDMNAGDIREDINRLSKFEDPYKQNVWAANAKIGVKNLPGADIKYQVQTGYEAFIVPDVATEHQVHTIGMLEWKRNFHHVGGVVDIQNRFYSVTDASIRTNANHRIHIEPFYAYDGRRWRVHAGVNLDFSAGCGKVPGISPNVLLEADLAKNWLAVYASATGNYAAYGARGEYRQNRYLTLQCMFDTIRGEYTPADIELGFKIRPYNTLLINIHAGYKMVQDKHINVYNLNAGADYGSFTHQYQTVSTWKIGGDIHFHYRDIVNVDIAGNYFANKPVTDPFDLKGQVVDMPSWRVDIRIEGKINQKWSLYSDNHLGGGSYACTYQTPDGRHPGDEPFLGYKAEKARSMFDLNLGVQYNVDKWLSVYAQLNNYLAWTTALSYSKFFGYDAMGANCLLGVSYSF